VSAIYLDYNATTPVAAEVLAAMLPYLEREFGNPSSAHAYGAPANAAVAQARAEVADLIAARSDGIVFTSGGTEATNHALKGVAFAALNAQPARRRIVVSAVEHPATLETARALARFGFETIKLGALRDVARARGLQAYAIAGTYEDLRRELSKGRPIVIGLQLPFERDRALHHYEVVVALHPRDGTVVTLDPATGKSMRRSQATLIAEWKPVGFPTLVVVGTADALNHRRR
jgi:hypothetical protein